MTDVPLPECLPKPEEPKAAEPQQSPQQPQFQQVPPPNYYQFPLQGYYQFPLQGFPNYPPPQPMPYFPNPWMFQQAPPQQFQSQSKSKRDQEFEEGLNRLRKDYATAPMEDDRLSVSSLKSTDSTRTTDSVRDREDYLKQSERLFILQPFTVGALKNMRNYEGQTPAGDRKTDVLARAVQLVKTKTEIVDFILAACPYK
ncbi:gamma-gliadin, putative [Trichomonas vaginalis G3]|uniref:Gamma-gliadin, putative n=3 Tax=Trichomonas vaginalis (strain ATCC PRA-98 / G3) TaxID=412133 RepID=A2DRP5_TRIV3|nr:gamma-gliadin, putative [Trichomonas vaginalis G3]|eukprot:XP_001329065.1 gamma-gliadin [Trichomonas vaginalis G3]